MYRRVLISVGVILGIAVLVIEGYYVLRFYGDISRTRVDAANYQTTVPEETVETDETEPTTPDEPAISSMFVHGATPGNSRGDYTYLDDPGTNGNPNAVLLVTPRLAAGEDDGTRNAHNIGVWYEAGQQKWAIYNQDRTAIPGGATFNVIVLEGPNKLVHRAKPTNTASHTTYVDHSLANENPDALLAVTPNWNPGGGGGIYDDHPVGVRYDPDRRRWAIFNRDLEQMPNQAAFNVAIWTNQMQDG